MKILVVLTFYFSLIRADISSTQDVKPKPTQKTTNSLPMAQKQEYYQPMHYQQQLQPQIQPQTQYLRLIQKPIYVPQQQPAMIIIAQPAYLPANLVYGNPTQQLLNFFHNNPQARYQLLHGLQQTYQQSYQPQSQPQPQPQLQHHLQPQFQSQPQVQPQQVQHHYIQQPAVAAAPSIGNYQIIAAPTHYQPNLVPTQTQSHLPFAHTSSLHSPQAAGHYAIQQPVQLNQIAHLAQLAAQQYAHSPLKTAPPIITGFENFTPEQQTKIKAQLSAHFGSALQPLSSTSQASSNKKPQQENLNGPQYTSRYQPTQPSNDFVPSQQIIKNDASLSSSHSSSESMKTQYSKM